MRYHNIRNAGQDAPEAKHDRHEVYVVRRLTDGEAGSPTRPGSKFRVRCEADLAEFDAFGAEISDDGSDEPTLTVQVKRDGKPLALVADSNAAFKWLMRHQGQSTHYAMRYGGYRVTDLAGVELPDMAELRNH